MQRSSYNLGQSSMKNKQPLPQTSYELKLNQHARGLSNTPTSSIRIWQTRNRFVNPIPSNRHESFPLLLIRHAGSRLAWDIESIVDLDFEGGLKMLSIRSNRLKFVATFDTNRTNRLKVVATFKNEEGSCIVISWILSSGGLCRVRWKCYRFDWIRSIRHESFPLLSIHHAGRRFARRDSVRIESRHNVRIESNR